MVRINFGLLTSGVFLIIVAAWMAAFVLDARIQTGNVMPLILLSTGVWIIVVAGLRAVVVRKGSFSTFSWGMLLVVLGGSWFLSTAGMPVELMIVFVLLLLGALAVITALRSSGGLSRYYPK